MNSSGAILLGTHLAALSAGWSGCASGAAMQAAAGEAFALGYRVVETPLFEPDKSPLLQFAAHKPVECWAYTALPVACHLADRPEHARAWLGRSLRWCERSNVRVLGGALGWSPGVGLEPDDVERQRALLVEVLRDCAFEAQERGVTLALEPANRYETSLCNTLAQGVEIVRAIDMPNVRLLGNTYHMHLEEAEVASALRGARKALIGLHLAENTGGKLGSGAVAWESIWQALGEIDYGGALIITPWNGAARRARTSTGASAASDSLRFLRGAFRTIQFTIDARMKRASSLDEPPAEPKAQRKRKRSTTKSYRTR